MAQTDSPLPVSEEPTLHYSNHEVLELFKKIASGKSGVYFLTRNNKSATNYLECQIFKKILGRRKDSGHRNRDKTGERANMTETIHAFPKFLVQNERRE